MNALGRAIACIRIERGLSRYDLVQRAPISYPYLAEIENESSTKTPSHSMLEKVAAALGTTPAGLMARAEKIEADPRNGLK